MKNKINIGTGTALWIRAIIGTISVTLLLSCTPEKVPSKKIDLRAYNDSVMKVLLDSLDKLPSQSTKPK